jgi:hypothetical protein
MRCTFSSVNFLLLIGGALITTINLTPSVEAKTVWCKNFNLGCPTQEQVEKAIKYCLSYAENSFYDAVDEAIADPTVWQYAGEDSVKDYAEMIAEISMQTCLEHHPDLGK